MLGKYQENKIVIKKKLNSVNKLEIVQIFILKKKIVIRITYCSIEIFVTTSLSDWYNWYVDVISSSLAKGLRTAPLL